MKCLQKKCFRITRCVRRENIIIASLLLLFSVKMIMCRGVPELHKQRVLNAFDVNGIVCGLGIFKLITNLNEKRPSSVFSTLRLNFADNFPSYRRIIK